MARTCTVCVHSQRAVIDRIIAQGSLSNRAIASQFGLNRGAIDRHSDHLKDSVVRSAQKKAEKHAEVVKSDWMTRLESAHDAACRGIARAESDPDKWTHAAGFIATAAKICDTGLRATGGIDSGGTTINVGQMLVLPQSQQPAQLPGPQPALLEPGDIIDAEEE